MNGTIRLSEEEKEEIIGYIQSTHGLPRKDAEDIFANYDAKMLRILKTVITCNGEGYK
jgi:hypothetical protein